MTKTVHRLTAHEQGHLHALAGTKNPVWDQFVILHDGHYAGTRGVRLFDSAEAAAAAIKN